MARRPATKPPKPSGAAPQKRRQRADVDPSADGMREKAGRILTFYSYKGGTGRSMALANVAWILACNRKRVLVIDWDLEAPGLHRYFAPFLPDPDLTQSDGLIDFFCDFSEAARLQHLGVLRPSSQQKVWYTDYADLLRYAVSLEHEFPAPGTLDFVPCGRQSPAYAVRVNSFSWTDFYGSLGGGIFLESLKELLREEYDYVLIDSRTGFSDTSGICTVQMPDELVVFFTLNHQSISGAADAAKSASEQRRKPSGEPALRIWPVPTRVDSAEKERLETARSLARQAFAPFLLPHVRKSDRELYWGQVEVPYVAFYAYEEILATVADRPRLSSTLLASIERLTDFLTSGKVASLPNIEESERLRLLALFYDAGGKQRTSPSGEPKLYFSYTTSDVPRETMAVIAKAVEAEFGVANLFWDAKIPLSRPWREYLDGQLQASDYVLFFIGPGWLKSSNTQYELAQAIKSHKTVLPVLVSEEVFWSDLPKPLGSVMGLQLRLSPSRVLQSGIEELIQGLRTVLVQSPVKKLSINLEDPQKGRWGGRSARGGLKLSATVSAVSPTWFRVDLEVGGLNATRLQGEVVFHLHSSFEPPARTVKVKQGRARLTFHAYGAFTVGAEADGGKTLLELDLSKLPGAPKYFREH